MTINNDHNNELKMLSDLINYHFIKMENCIISNTTNKYEKLIIDAILDNNYIKISTDIVSFSVRDEEFNVFKLKSILYDLFVMKNNGYNNSGLVINVIKKENNSNKSKDNSNKLEIQINKNKSNNSKSSIPNLYSNKKEDSDLSNTNYNSDSDSDSDSLDKEEKSVLKDSKLLDINSKTLKYVDMVKNNTDKSKLLEEKKSIDIPLNTNNVNLKSPSDKTSNLNNKNENKSKLEVLSKPKNTLDNNSNLELTNKPKNTLDNKNTMLCEYKLDYLSNQKICKNKFAHNLTELIKIDCKKYTNCKNEKCYYKHNNQCIDSINRNILKYIELVKTSNLESKEKSIKLCIYKKHFDNKKNIYSKKCNFVHDHKDIDLLLVQKCGFYKECKNDFCLYNHGENEEQYLNRIKDLIFNYYLSLE